MSRRPRAAMARGRRRAVVLILASLAALGLVTGLLWAWIVETPLVTKDPGGLLTGGAELGRRVEADVWFALLAVASMLPAGLVVGLRRRGRPDPVVGLVAVTTGSLLAAAICALVGMLLGPGDPVAALEGAEIGAQAPEQLSTHTWVVYLVWPLSAAIGALLGLVLRPVPAEDDPVSTDVRDNAHP